MKLSKHSIIAVVLAGLFLSFFTVGIVAAAKEPTVQDYGRPVKQSYMSTPNQILVKFREGVDGGRKNAIKKAAGVEETIKRIGPRNHKDTYLLELKPGKTAAQAIKELRRNPDVVIAQPNKVSKSFFVPNDPSFANQWGLENVGQVIKGQAGTVGDDIEATMAWDYEQGNSSTVTVAVIDSGIDLNHPDLANKIRQNGGEVPNNEIDDDLNGYVDDVAGFNFGGITMNSYNWVRPLGSPNAPATFAQSIKGTGGPLSEVGLGLLKVGEPSFGAVISIRDSLNGSALATATFSPGEVPAAPPGFMADSIADQEIVETAKSLSSSVRLADDQTYYIALETTATDPANYYLVADLSSAEGYDIYKEGMEHWKIGGTWLNMPKYDLTFRTNDNAVPHDDNGHGTHVSGIIGAQTDNALGVAGVSPGARIMPVKAGGANGFFYNSDLYDAIYYAADNGAKVINMSLGGASYDDLMQLAVYYAAGKGVTVVAAAGNDGNDAINYPAGYDLVLGVGALNNYFETGFHPLTVPLPVGYWATFSNINTRVDFSAPGVNILSTMPTYPVASSTFYAPDYDYMSGTSMAAPFVSGLASLIIARQPEANVVQVEKALDKGVDDLGYLGYDPWYGHGRINANRSMMGLLLNTRVSALPASSNGDNGWYTTTPTIALEIDETAAASFYVWDSTAGPTTTYTVPFSPPAEGKKSLYYFSTLGGATEEAQKRTFKVDTGIPSDPTTVTSGTHTTGTVSADRIVGVSVAGATDSVSGVEGYSVLWSEDNTVTPPAAMTDRVTVADFTSPALADGNWWFNLRTKDLAGNWTATVHLGPFAIDGAPTTGRLVGPALPDGENSWYKTSPLVTLTPDEVAAVLYQLDSTSALGWIGDAVPDISVPLNIPDGQHMLYYFSSDGVNTETVKNSSLTKVDTVVPTGTVSINGGGAKTGSAAVELTLSSNDANSGVSKMRFKNEGGAWSAWEAAGASKTWVLSGVNGTKKVFVQFKDAAGNESAAGSDDIVFNSDVAAPSAAVSAPSISTNVSKKKTFKVAWSGSDPAPSSGIVGYDVQYRVGPAGAWTDWKSKTTAVSGVFTGSPGKTYYFKVRAKDGAGWVGSWSGEAGTIVPYDQNSLISGRKGYGHTFSSAVSGFYLGSLRYSTKGGDAITYKFAGKSAAVISTKSKNRSKAKIYIDGKYVKTIDAYDASLKYRQAVYSVKWASSGPHTLKIINQGTSGRSLFDIDGLAVGR